MSGQLRCQTVKLFQSDLCWWCVTLIERVPNWPFVVNLRNLFLKFKIKSWIVPSQSHTPSPTRSIDQIPIGQHQSYVSCFLKPLSIGMPKKRNHVFNLPLKIYPIVDCSPSHETFKRRRDKKKKNKFCVHTMLLN